MDPYRSNMWFVAIGARALAMPALAFGQGATSNITGRATDSSEGALPGVTVSITSPNLIGGARSAVTDDQGVYRFTQLPAGIDTVKFELAGFSILNVEGIQVSGGATMTINGKLPVASVEEIITGDQSVSHHRPRIVQSGCELGPAEA